MDRDQDNDIDVNDVFDAGGCISATVAGVHLGERTAVVTGIANGLEIPRLNSNGPYLICREDLAEIERILAEGDSDPGGGRDGDDDDTDDLEVAGGDDEDDPSDEDQDDDDLEEE